MKTIKINTDKHPTKSMPHTQILMIFCLILLGFTSNAQDKNDNGSTTVILDPAYTPPLPDSVRVFSGIDTMPKFYRNLMGYFADSIRYPQEAKEKKIGGIVFVDAIIQRDGSISNIKVLRSPDTSLNNEAKRVVSTMPKWMPGKHNGKPVRVDYVIPVYFNLATTSASGTMQK